MSTPINDMSSYIPTVHNRVMAVLSTVDPDVVKKEIFFTGQKAALERMKKAFGATKVTSDALKDPLGCFRVSWTSQFGEVRVFILLKPEGWYVETWGWDKQSEQWILGCKVEEPATQAQE
jgi:hypothetical protein